MQCPFCDSPLTPTAQRTGRCPECGNWLPKSSLEPTPEDEDQKSLASLKATLNTIVRRAAAEAGQSEPPVAPTPPGADDPPVRHAPVENLNRQSDPNAQTMDVGSVPPVPSQPPVDQPPADVAAPGENLSRQSDPNAQTMDVGSQAENPGNAPGDIRATPSDIRATPRDESEGSQEARMSQMWSDAAGGASSPRMTVKTRNNRVTLGTSLVIKPRTIRKGVELTLDDMPQFASTTEKPDLATLSQDLSTDTEYELLGLIGEGGMGVVFAARQASIDRMVAIKMLKANASASLEDRQKFLSEAVVTGDLDHPNIVPIYDLATNEAGGLFYSMKCVQGTPWMDVLFEKSLTENLEILNRVADAIAFAHSRNVVHRDIKPENVMLGGFGEVLVMDWGLALVGEGFRKSTNIRQSSSMGGTPAYMAPEMATGPIEEVTSTSDIYLLGATLFEIITGNPPHTGANVMSCLFAAGRNEIQSTDKHGELLDIALKAMATRTEDRYATVQEFQDAVREYQSHSESIVLSTNAQQDLTLAQQTSDYQDFSRALFGFQEAFSLWSGNSTAREGEQQARLAYAENAWTKDDLDLAASLLDPENSEHAPLLKKIRKAQKERDAHHQRLKVLRVVAAGMLLLVMAVVSVAYFQVSSERDRALAAETRASEGKAAAEKARTEAESAEKRAQQQKALADQAARDALVQKENADKQRADAVVARNEAEKATRRAEDALIATNAAKAAEEYEAYVARIGLAAAKIDENAFDSARQLLSTYNQPAEPNLQLLRHWEWGRLMYLCQMSERTWSVGSLVDAVAFSPNGLGCVTGSRNGLAQIWDLTTEQVIASMDHAGQYVLAVAMSPDGRYVATGGSDPQQNLNLWDAQSGQLIRRFVGHEGGVLSVEFSADGRWLLSSSYDRTARLWDIATGTLQQTMAQHTWWVWDATFSPDMKQIVTASQDATAIVWGFDARRQQFVSERTYRGHAGPVYTACFSPDGKRVASGGYDSTIRIWNPQDIPPLDLAKVIGGETVAAVPAIECRGHQAGIRSISFSKKGQMLDAAGLQQHSQLLLSSGHDNNLIVWDPSSGEMLKTLRGHSRVVTGCALSPDGNQAISASHDESIRLWNITGYEEVRVLQTRVLKGHSDAVLSVAFSPDGARAVTASRDRTGRVWDLRNGQSLLALEEGHAFLASSALFFPDGMQLVTSAIDNTTRIWDVTTGVQTASIDGTGRNAAIALSSDASMLVTGSEDLSVQVWDVANLTGKPRLQLPGHISQVSAVAVSPDGSQIFSGDERGRCYLWDVATAKLLWNVRGHTRKVYGAAFTPDGLRVVTASGDQTVEQWDVATGEQLSDGRLQHRDAVTSLSLTANGEQALTVCDDGSVRLWDLANGSVLRTMRPRTGFPTGAAMTADGQFAFAVCANDGQVHQWNLRTGAEVTNPHTRGPFLDFKKQGGQVWSAACMPGGLNMLTVGGNGAQLWNVANAELQMSFSPHGIVASAGFSPTGDRIVTASWDNSARIWDAQSGKALLKLMAADQQAAGMEKGHTGFVNSAVFSPDGQTVLTGSDDGTAKLWDIGGGTAVVLKTLAGHQGRVRSCEFSPDGRYAVTGSDDRTLRVWELATAKTLVTLGGEQGHNWGVTSAAFSHDGKRIISGSEDNTSKLWNAVTGELLGTLEGHTAAVNSVVFAPHDTRRVLTASEDGTAKLWDSQQFKEILTLKAHTEAVTGAQFSPDGTQVLTSSRDNTAILWLAEPWKPAPATRTAETLAPPVLSR